MLRFPLVLLSIVLTFCCWGTYGPVLHEGQMAMGLSRWRPFICVGVAYFFVAVVVPLIVGRFHTESGRWTFRGVVWSLTAGAVGALGSLGIIIAFTLGMKPIYVMPLVFGCAPVVNTLVTMLMTKTGKKPGLIFYLGILMVALGGAGVLTFKPKPTVAHVDNVSEAVGDTTIYAQVINQAVEPTEEPVEAPAVASPDSAATAIDAAGTTAERLSFGELVGAVATVFMTICCWGSYGPMLHRGQAKMDGSRLRPFICVGIAYFLVAILVPSGVIWKWDDVGAWTMEGSLWSLLSGALGAVGALGIIMAFNFGGRPVYVMPLVFGGAPIINTATSMFKSYVNLGAWGSLSSYFMGSLGLVIAGAATVLIFAPKPDKPAPIKPNVPDDKSSEADVDTSQTSVDTADA